MAKTPSPSKKSTTNKKTVVPPKIVIELIVRIESNTPTRTISTRGIASRQLSYLRSFELNVEDDILFFTDSIDIDNAPPVEIMVKTVILKIADRPGDPEKLGDDEELGDLFTSDAQYVLLRAYLEAIARLTNKNAKITLGEVMGCTTVKDCIDLVKTKM